MSVKPTLNMPNEAQLTGDRGINSNQVPAAKAEFETYKNEINTMFNNFKDEITTYDNAFFGSNGKVKQYVDSVIDECNNLMQTLAELGDLLDKAARDYATTADSVYGGMK